MKRLILFFVLFVFLGVIWADTITVGEEETIQEAIDRAVAGDTVIIPAGTYLETILIEKDLTLDGEPGAIIQTPENFGSANSLVIVRGDNVIEPISVTIQNLEFQNNDLNPIKFGIFFWENLTAYFVNNTVSGFNIEDGTSYGIGLICHQSTGGEVTGNTFIDNAGCINISSSSDMLVDNNQVTEFTKWGLNTSMAIDCTVSNNNVISTGEYLLYGALLGNSSNGVVYDNNTFNLPTYSLLEEGTHPDSLYSVRPYGISISTGGDFDNTISNNSFNGCSRCIENESNQYGTINITGNIFGETLSPSFASIFFDGGNANITSNTFEDTVRSIEFVNTGDINISENMFNGMSYMGLASINLQHDCFGAVTINENSFDNNRDLNLWNQSDMLTNNMINAGYNWWGASNPTIKILDLGAPIAPDTTWTPASPVDYTPWYMDATMDDLAWDLDATLSAELAIGWNLWSYNVVIADHTVEAVFAPIIDNLVKVKSILESYDPNLDPQFNTLEVVEDGHGYWVNVSAVDSLTLTGLPMPLTTNISLNSGWNLLAFLPQEDYEVEHTFATLIDNEQLVKVKSILESYDPNLEPMFNTLEVLSPANGYWVNVNEDLIFNYPENSERAEIAENENIQYIWTPVIYTNSTCAYARIDLDEGQIGAFVNGECRAVTEIRDGFVSLVINGETYETVSFKLYQNGMITDLDTYITTDPGNDVFFEFGETETMPTALRLNSAYPNPFNPETTISLSIPENTEITLNAYNVKGQKVAEIVNGTYSAGNHQVVWNAETQPSGIYFLKLKAGDSISSSKVILMK